LLSACWILFSDRLVQVLAGNQPERITQFSTYKGIFFIVVTGILLFFLVEGLSRPRPSLDASSSGPLPEAPRLSVPILLFTGLSVSFALLGWGVFHLRNQTIHRQAEEQLLAVCRIKTDQLNRWTSAFLREGRQLGADNFLARETERALRAKGPLKLQAFGLQERLEGILKAGGHAGLAMLDEQGGPRWTMGEVHTEDPLQGTFAPPFKTGAPLLRHGWTQTPEPRLFLQLMVPLTSEGSSPRAFLLIEHNPAEELWVRSAPWPAATRSGRALLLTQEAGQRFQMDFRQDPQGLWQVFKVPFVGQVEGLAVPDAHREALRTSEHAVANAFFALRPLEALPWYLTTLQDPEEIERPVRVLAIRLLFTGLVLIMAAGFVALAWWRHQQTTWNLRAQLERNRNQETVTHLDFLTHHTHDAILLVDAQHRIVRSLGRIEGIYGFPSLEGRHLREILAAEAQASLHSDWDQANPEGRVFETWHRRADGTSFPVEVSSRRVQFEGADYHLSVVRDISERVQVEAAIHQERSHFELLVESVDGVVWEIDLGTHAFTFVSGKIRSLLGFEPEYWLGRFDTFAACIHSDDRQRALDFCSAETQALRDHALEYRMIDAKGREIWVRDIASVGVQDGKAVTLRGLLIDVTQQHHLEEKLAAARDFYLEVLEQMPNPVWRTNPLGQPSHFNPAWLAFTGLDRAQALASDWGELVHAEDREDRKSALALALSTQTAYSLTYRLRHHNGQFHWLSEHAVPLFGGKQDFLGFVGTCHDLQAVKQAELELRRTRDLYQALFLTNQAIARATEGQGLFQTVCDIAVDFGHFPLAWIGLVDRTQRCVIPTVSSGPGRAYMEGNPFTIDPDRPTELGPVARAVLSGENRVVPDFLDSPETAPWHEAARQSGILAMAAFPLRQGGVVVGVLAVYAAQRDFFGPDETELLAEMAADLTLALESLNAETERAEATEALRASEHRLRTLLDNQGEGFMVVDATERITFANPAAEEIFGIAAGGLPGHNLAEFISPQTYRFIQAQTHQRQAGARNVYEMVIQRPDGQNRTLLVTATPQLDATGAYLGANGIFRDITERKHTEQALRESERNLAQAQALARIGSWTWKAGAERPEWSAELFHLLGLTASTVPLGLEAFLLQVAEPARSELRHAMAWVFERGDAFELELSFQRADGKTLMLQAAADSIRSADGQVIEVRGYFRDATHERQTQEELRLAKHLLDTSPEGIFGVDVSGRVRHINAAASTSLGYSREELLQLAVWDLDPTQSPEAWPQTWERLRQAGTLSLETVHACKSGSEIPVEIQTVMVHFGSQEFAYGFVRDIQARKAAEKARKLTDEALHESEQRLTLALEAGNQGLFDVNLRTGATTVSPEYARILGHDPWEFRETLEGWMGRIHPLDRAWVEPLFAQHLAGEDAQASAEFRMQTRNGEWKWILAFSRLVDWDRNGQPRRLVGTIQEISARKTAELALRENEEKYRAVVENTTDTVMRFDREGRHLFVNQAVLSLVDQPLEAFLGRTHAELGFPIHLCEFWEAQIQRVFSTAEAVECEFELPGAKGTHVVDWRLFPEFDPLGNVSTVLGIGRDITERKLAEQALRMAYSRQKDIQSAVDEAALVTITDVDGSILYVNDRVLRLHGYTREEVLGQNPRIWNSRFHPHAFFRGMWDTLAAGQVWHGELCNRTRDGHALWLDTTIVPFLSEQGKPYQYMAIRFDITDRKGAENQLQEASAERAVLLEAASVAKVLPWTLDTQHGTLQMGDSALEVLGMPARSFRNHPNQLKELLRPEDRPLFAHAQQEARSGRPASFEAALKRGEKQSIWTRWTLAQHGPLLHGVIQDITESHELQGQLLQSQKLESLGTLLSGITHDFNNLLMGILGYTEVLSMTKDLPPIHQKGLEVIRRAAERGSGLVNQLLKFSRKTAPARSSHCLNDTANEVRSLLQLPGDQRIQVRLELDPDLPSTLADAGQMHQVLMNLAVNGRDAIPGQGNLIIRTGRDQVEASEAQSLGKRPGEYVYLEVEDSGTGMSRELMARVFEPFFTTKGIGKGTGLGLSVVHGIVETHGGFLRMESHPGAGTRFRVMLPLLTEDATEGGEDSDFQTEALRILLVDDPGTPQSTLIDLLTVLGHQVLVAESPEQILARHRSSPLSLAILNPDAALGAQFLKGLQEQLPDLSIIAALQSPERAWKGHRAPVAVIQWPYRAGEVLDALQRFKG